MDSSYYFSALDFPPYLVHYISSTVPTGIKAGLNVTFTIFLHQQLEGPVGGYEITPEDILYVAKICFKIS